MAGGLGTRLGPLTKEQPKALVPVLGRPFLFHQLDLLKRNGIRRVVLSVGYKAGRIEAALKKNPVPDMTIDCVEDGPVPLGTGGGVKKAAELLSGDFFVLYGDSYLDIDYDAVRLAYKNSGKQGLMVVYRNHNLIQESNVIFENGRVVKYGKHQKEKGMDYIDYGLSVLGKKILKSFTSKTSFDLADIHRLLIESNELAGYETKQRFYEVGSSQGITDLENYLMRG